MLKDLNENMNMEMETTSRKKQMEFLEQKNTVSEIKFYCRALRAYLTLANKRSVNLKSGQ